MAFGERSSASTYPNETCAGTRELAVPLSLVNLTDAVSQVSDLASNLSKRLECVCRCEPTDVPGDAVANGSPIAPKLAVDFDAQTLRLRCVTDLLRDVERRLEV